MPSLHPPLTKITTAERSGGDRPSQDRIFLTDNAVIVLDGASHPDPAARDGRWIADRLGEELRSRLADDPAIDLRVALRDAIGTVARRHHLAAGSSPSTTVNIVRWNDDTLDVLVLCDSPVVVIDRTGTAHELRDDRLGSVNDEIGRPAGYQQDNPDAWRTFVAVQSQRRNKHNGYWVAEADPRAAEHAVTATWPLIAVAGVLAMTDGISRGVDKYGVPPTWREAYELAITDPARLVDIVHQAEVSDPAGDRWPRSKRHDDKALAVIQFNANGAISEPFRGPPKWHGE
jgi:hypothetical protein